MNKPIIYGRIVDKKELKFLLNEQTLIAQEEGQLIPAFYISANQFFLYEFFGELQENKKFRDKVKHIHKEVGSSGAGQFVVLFIALEDPVVSGIRLRKEPIPGLREAKFHSGTRILIQKRL